MNCRNYLVELGILVAHPQLSSSRPHVPPHLTRLSFTHSDLRKRYLSTLSTPPMKTMNPLTIR